MITDTISISLRRQKWRVVFVVFAIWAEWKISLTVCVISFLTRSDSNAWLSGFNHILQRKPVLIGLIIHPLLMTAAVYLKQNPSPPSCSYNSKNRKIQPHRLKQLINNINIMIEIYFYITSHKPTINSTGSTFRSCFFLPVGCFPDILTWSIVFFCFVLFVFYPCNFP